jgi:hypothetical protein
MSQSSSWHQKYQSRITLASGSVGNSVKKLKISIQKGKNHPQLSHIFAPTLQGNRHLYIFVF